MASELRNTVCTDCGKEALCEEWQPGVWLCESCYDEAMDAEDEALSDDEEADDDD